VLAASANAHPTSTLMSSSRAASAISAGTIIPATAAQRNRRIRSTGWSPREDRRVSCESVPAIDTSSPDDVDVNAANAPAAVSAASSSPPSPGQAASGSSSTTESVSPVTYSSGVSARPRTA
jgi:hypothetical protein